MLCVSVARRAKVMQIACDDNEFRLWRLLVKSCHEIGVFICRVIPISAYPALPAPQSLRRSSRQSPY